VDSQEGHDGALAEPRLPVVGFQGSEALQGLQGLGRKYEIYLNPTLLNNILPLIHGVAWYRLLENERLAKL
jgi:hypothetical protein